MAYLQYEYNWAKHVNMEFNADKFECLQFGPNPMSDLTCQYMVPDNSFIQVKDSLCDLGVQLSNVLSFPIHIESIVTAASRLARWGMRTFRWRRRALMLAILKKK